MLVNYLLFVTKTFLLCGDSFTVVSSSEGESKYSFLSGSF